MTPNFQGLRVLTLESRREKEMASLISTLGGQPIVAPGLREVPLESNTGALAFAAAVQRGGFDIVIFLTGAGTRALVAAVEHVYPRAALADALRHVRIVARGPKPVAALRELNVPIWLIAPEPNTWHEVMAVLDERSAEQSLSGARVAVQEYGVSNVDLLQALRARGAVVTPVPVYRWALPLDVAPLHEAARALARGDVDVAIFTTGVQLLHLWTILKELRLEDQARRQLSRMVVASIGPTTSEELQRHGITPDIEASHPKMGVLVREAAAQAPDRLRAKRSHR